MNDLRLRMLGVAKRFTLHQQNALELPVFERIAKEVIPKHPDIAQRRALNEPLSEIVQNKGQSDTLPELSPNDEFANFEIMDRLYRGETTEGRRLDVVLRRLLNVLRRLVSATTRLTWVTWKPCAPPAPRRRASTAGSIPG